MYNVVKLVDKASGYLFGADETLNNVGALTNIIPGPTEFDYDR